MSPKPARIQLAQPTPVFSAAREGMGQGQAQAGAASLQAQGTGCDGTGVPAAGAGAASHLSTATAPSSPALPPHSPQLQALSPSPLVLYLALCCWNPNELSILWPPHFPTEGQCLPAQGPAEPAREEKPRAEECFSALFIPPPPALCYFLSLSVCMCVSGALFTGHPPSAPLLLAFIPLALL